MIARRNVLAATALAAGAVVFGGEVARAEDPRDEFAPDAGDWRWVLGESMLGSSPSSISVTPLNPQSENPLECWVFGGAGYAVVDPTNRVYLEFSDEAANPYRLNAGGDRLYNGPGQFFAVDKGRAVNVLDGEVVEPASVQAASAEFSAFSRDFDSENQRAPEASSEPGKVQPMAKPVPPKAGTVKKLVTSASFVTGSRVYPNKTDICGWVAGSILTRYWHARKSSKGLLPKGYRSGTNMTSSPNFASHLQKIAKGRNKTWAPDLVRALQRNASNRKVSVDCYYNWGNSGVASQINANRPVLLFGRFPTTSGKSKSSHAVVAYGLVKNGDAIVHYGYSGYPKVVLAGGLVGTNTKFWIK
ncbi:hypothetical protein [Brachybacterium sp. EE-P12]|uniref:Uncharacterized protein n=1 Tax=Candidatus Brachybacterium intestinipullorum TaxID=2838512 RepID=A0A9D2Q418_9MICO|nr:hypothetical protein [Brachybacterium sp. EE-P12]HJC71057.1 hypothetical protein [Candidatus Brachybacterium intestinipullorum]